MPQRPIQSSEFTRFSSLAEFSKSWDRTMSGSIAIGESLPYLISWDFRGADTTIVSFSAASSKIQSLPYWSGRGVTKNLDANVALISDPTMILDSTLNLGWYAGNPYQPNLHDELTEILRTLVGDNVPVLFGSSAGGWAALSFAHELEGAIAVPLNPQTDITKYLYYPYYLRKVWNTADKGFELPFATSMVDVYANTQSGTRVVYVQNSGDDSHVRGHFQPFKDAYDPSGSLLALTPTLGSGHVAPSAKSIETLLSTIIANKDNWPSFKAACNALKFETSGVDLEFKGNSEKYPLLQEKKFGLPLGVTSIALQIQCGRALEPKDLLIGIDFDSTQSLPESQKQQALKVTGLSWTPYFSLAFQYCERTSPGEYVELPKFAPPADAKELIVSIHQWKIRRAMQDDLKVTAKATVELSELDG